MLVAGHFFIVVRVPAASLIHVNAPGDLRTIVVYVTSAPPGRENSAIGNMVAAWTIATSSGDGESEVISQPEPTSFMQVPTLAALVAIQSAR